MKNLIILFFVLTSFSLNDPFVYSQSDQDVKEPAVRAYFVGYQEDDLVFHIVNETQEDAVIQGLSYRRQILYRPIEKDVIIVPANDEHPFAEVKLRSTGDFVWSENHMHMFQVAYSLLEQKEKKYTPLLLKQTRVLEEQKE